MSFAIQIIRLILVWSKSMNTVWYNIWHVMLTYTRYYGWHICTPCTIAPDRDIRTKPTCMQAVAHFYRSTPTLTCHWHHPPTAVSYSHPMLAASTWQYSPLVYGRRALARCDRSNSLYIMSIHIRLSHWLIKATILQSTFLFSLLVFSEVRNRNDRVTMKEVIWRKHYGLSQVEFIMVVMVRKDRPVWYCVVRILKWYFPLRRNRVGIRPFAWNQFEWHDLRLDDHNQAGSYHDHGRWSAKKSEWKGQTNSMGRRNNLIAASAGRRAGCSQPPHVKTWGPAAIAKPTARHATKRHPRRGWCNV